MRRSSDPTASDFGIGKSLAAFEETSIWMLMAEEGNHFDRNISTNDGVFATGDTISGRHLDGSNLLFIDGHVKWNRPGSFEGNKSRTGGTGDTTDCF
ncbi:MAG: hypothetical protein KY445_06175 [Armatimonadetes bacterium]|nr:hypothetical protein [Armatimonadota bacterium]